MHLAREGRAGYNKAMQNYYRIMLESKSVIADYKIGFKLEKR